MEEWVKLDVERTDDVRYLYRCGLIVRYTNDKQCLVVHDHLHMAKEFLKGKRLSEELGQLRRKRKPRW